MLNCYVYPLFVCGLVVALSCLHRDTSIKMLTAVVSFLNTAEALVCQIGWGLGG